MKKESLYLHQCFLGRLSLYSKHYVIIKCTEEYIHLHLVSILFIYFLHSTVWKLMLSGACAAYVWWTGTDYAIFSTDLFTFAGAAWGQAWVRIGIFMVSSSADGSGLGKVASWISSTGRMQLKACSCTVCCGWVFLAHCWQEKWD